jgi:hypothetical protein
MEKILKILDLIGYISTGIVVIAFFTGITLWFRGIFPAVFRLGNGLAKRKIAIFAKQDNLSSLKNLLIHSKLFKEKNICEITKKEDIGMCEDATLYLVFWHDCSDYIDMILQKKPDSCALIVYSPRNMEPIPAQQMENLDGHRNTAVSNFRGRLLNDIVTAMITTGYSK